MTSSAAGGVYAMTDFRITLPCAECVGTGEIENQIAAGDFSISICGLCWGNGFKSHTEMYDCIEDARLDYPNALGIEGERGGRSV